MAITERVSKFLNFWYYQYILHTGLYMLEEWERRVFTSVIIALMAMASYTAYLYLPGHIDMLTNFISLHVLGHHSEASATMDRSDAGVKLPPKS